MGRSLSKDWSGNSVAFIATNGFHNLSNHDRETHDYYATHPSAGEMLLELEELNNIWECACGEGHLSQVFEKAGKLGRESDLLRRGYDCEVLDFLQYSGGWDGDIVTNPPYKHAEQFIRKALEVIPIGRKVAMFLPVRYLEGKSRRRLFEEYPPKCVYVSSSRIKCAINGEFDSMKSAVTYCWIIWQKGYEGATELKWFN